MTKEGIHKKLGLITEVFIAEENDYHLLASTIKEYKDLLIQISQINFKADNIDNNLILQNGMALGSRWAADCVDDMLRTKRFIKGTYEAVKSLIDSGRKNIHLLYAGTGPFATLILPLVTRFSHHEIKFTLLEVNPLSFEYLLNTISALEIENYMVAVENRDAAGYHISDDREIDILLCETMQHALIKELQVSIVASLFSQLKNEVILIPQKIVLQLGLIRQATNQQPETGLPNNISIPCCRILGSFFELSRETLGTTALKNYSRECRFKSEEVNIFLNGPTISTDEQLCVFTQVNIFGKEMLSLDESGLTAPLILSGFQQPDSVPQYVTVWYQITEEPSIGYQFN